MLSPDQKAGLERLARAVLVAYKPKEKPEAIARRLAWAHTILPKDTLESLQHRQGLTRSQVASRISLLRRYVGLSKAQTIATYWEVAQQYIKFHEARRYHR